MNWTCNNCGKQMEVSQEQLLETGGVVVCPQCLESTLIPGYKSGKRKSSTSPTIPPIPPTTMANNNTPPAHGRRQIINFAEPTSRPTPPPHQRRTAQRTTNQPSPATPPARPKQNKKSRKSSGNGFFNPPGAIGCVLRTAVFTVGLLLVYLLMGLVMGM